MHVHKGRQPRPLVDRFWEKVDVCSEQNAGRGLAPSIRGDMARLELTVEDR